MGMLPILVICLLTSGSYMCYRVARPIVAQPGAKLSDCGSTTCETRTDLISSRCKAEPGLVLKADLFLRT